MGLLGQILQEQRVHRALEANVQVRDVALGQRDDVHAREGEALEQTGRVFLVAAESIERLGEDHIESTVQRIAHQRLETRSKQRGAGHRVVGVLLRDRPALPLGKGPTDPHLIGDGRVTLVVRRVARVDGDLHGWRASMNLCKVARSLRLEQLPRSLTGKRSDESAQMLVTLRVDLVVRVRANVRPMLSPPLAPMPSSFGHDTPAHVERRCRFRVLVLL
ncbi:MAG: hypothetical protein WBC51_14630 [Vicinamibacterales bacterium]